MKRILGLTAAALLGASAMAAPALAQTVDVQPEVNAEGGLGAGSGSGPDGASTMDLDTGTTAAIGASPDLAISAIGGSSAAAAALGTMTEVETVNVVRVSEFGSEDAQAVEDAATANQAGIDELRAAIQANAALSQQLQAEGVDSASVVGADVGAGGELTVYVM
jgi:hypothetical protein